jgi:hypothetical protein
MKYLADLLSTTVSTLLAPNSTRRYKAVNKTDQSSKCVSHSNRSISKSIQFNLIKNPKFSIQYPKPPASAKPQRPASTPIARTLHQLNPVSPTQLTHQALSFGKFVYSSNSTIFSPSSEPGVAARAEEFPFLEDDLRKADRVRTKRARWRRRRGRGA